MTLEAVIDVAAGSGWGAIAVLLYLAYEIHYGRFDLALERLRAVEHAVVSIARVQEDIDHQLITQELNVESPDDYIEKSSIRNGDGPPFEQDESTLDQY